MGVPTSEVGYTPAMPRREDHEVHKRTCGGIGKKKISLTSMLSGGWGSTPRPGRFTPGKDPIRIVWEAGWAPGPVWTGAENLAFKPGALLK